MVELREGKGGILLHLVVIPAILSVLSRCLGVRSLCSSFVCGGRVKRRLIWEEQA